MKKITVIGNRPLGGEIEVGGSKNAALPIIFACILMHGCSVIRGLPPIGDVDVALDIISSLGARIERQGSVTMIDTSEIYYSDPPRALVSGIRASTYLIGSCLSRFGRCRLSEFGGCNFSLRPIDLHLAVCTALGCSIDGDMLSVTRPRGAEIDLAIPSVGATVNAILLSASADGDTIIRGCAIEPHIDALIDFINSAGGVIRRIGREVHVSGRSLSGGNIEIIGDMIEAGSYYALSLLTGSAVKIKNAPLSHMGAIFDSLSTLGVGLPINGVIMRTDVPRYMSVTTAPYPGFPTDLQPLVAPLMAAFSGGEITDPVWPERLGYLSSLADFGIVSRIAEGRAFVLPSEMHSGVSSATDLRGGMAALITALAADGKSEIYSAEKIFRGYGDLYAKLTSLGAEIKIEDI